jgi:hypothetical protein
MLHDISVFFLQFSSKLLVENGRVLLSIFGIIQVNYFFSKIFVYKFVPLKKDHPSPSKVKWSLSKENAARRG